jgi:uncharacterized phage protein (TIGR01671 family)
MQTIKFRYWDGEYNKMCDVRAIVWNDGVVAAIDVHDKEHIMRRPNMFFNNALLQYTGLKDNRNKEIYEGDILSTPYKGIYRVEYNAGTFIGVHVRGKVHSDSSRPHFWHMTMEVIGNIYENAELLKEVK